jgi:hypothetical protein
VNALASGTRTAQPTTLTVQVESHIVREAPVEHEAGRRLVRAANVTALVALTAVAMVTGRSTPKEVSTEITTEETSVEVRMAAERYAACHHAAFRHVVGTHHAERETITGQRGHQFVNLEIIEQRITIKIRKALLPPQSDVATVHPATTDLPILTWHSETSLRHAVIGQSLSVGNMVCDTKN